MQTRSKLGFLAILALMVNISSCRTDECDQIIPDIELERFVQYRDSANLVITFKDCDGDIGLTDEQTEGDFRYNLFVDYYELQNGVWVVNDSLPPFLYYRVPFIDPEGSSKIMEGEIEIKLFNYYNPSSPFDTIRYEIELKDRSLNTSNRIVTPIYLSPR